MPNWTEPFVNSVMTILFFNDRKSVLQKRNMRCENRVKLTIPSSIVSHKMHNTYNKIAKFKDIFACWLEKVLRR